MTNGIRQGSLISPYLFNVYIDDLNLKIAKSKLGCHIAGKAVNNFAYADDLALIAPTARALNDMLKICDKFADNHDVIFSTSKSVAMFLSSKRSKTASELPNIYLSNQKLDYVSNFRYLGHYITTDFRDDTDIQRELKSLYTRGNIIVRKFGFLTTDVKCTLFKSFCYPLYTSSLWSRFNQYCLNKLKVAYNNIMRKLVGLAPWDSASRMFGTLGVRSFYETIRIASYSLMNRISRCPSEVIVLLNNCDASTYSRIRARWNCVLGTIS